VRKLDIKALPQQEAMEWAEEHPHLLKKRGGDPPGQHPNMMKKEAMKWAHIDQGARQKQQALRKLEARSDATSQEAAQWAEEHPKFLKEHPKLASSVAEAGGHPFLMKRLMAGGPNQGTNQPSQGPTPQQQQDAPLIAPLIADAPSQQQAQAQAQQLIQQQSSQQQQSQQQSQQQQQPATRPHKSQQSLSEIIRGIIHAPEQQQQQQAAQLSSKVMTQQEQWMQEPVNGNTAPQQQQQQQQQEQQRGAVDATQLRKQEGQWVSQPLTASEGAAPASQQDAAILKQMLKPITKPYRRTEGATASGKASMVALPQLETHMAKQQQAPYCRRRNL
jgi:hypothetical protein